MGPVCAVSLLFSQSWVWISSEVFSSKEMAGDLIGNLYLATSCSGFWCVVSVMRTYQRILLGFFDSQACLPGSGREEGVVLRDFQTHPARGALHHSALLQWWTEGVPRHLTVVVVWSCSPQRNRKRRIHMAQESEHAFDLTCSPASRESQAVSSADALDLRLTDPELGEVDMALPDIVGIPQQVDRMGDPRSLAPDQVC